MITEDYISFETAKLLKEKGFEGQCFAAYNGNGKLYGFDEEVDDNIPYWSDAPTLQMAMKWLREVHNIHVVPKYDFYAGDYTGRKYDGRRESTAEKDDYIAIVGNSTYEQAAGAAIKYCLENLI